MTAVFQDALEILGTLDLDDVGDRLLTLFAHATRAAGVSLWLVRDGEVVLHGEWGDLGPHPVAFPLLAGVETLGIVHVQPHEGRTLSPEQRADAVALSQAGSLALQNAARFEALQQRTLRDDAYGTYRVAYLDDHARKELDKARRYGRCFTVARVSVDDMEAIVRGAGRDAARTVDRGVIAAVTAVMREADVLARASDGEYRVLLPETDRFGALAFVRRAGNELHRTVLLPGSGRPGEPPSPLVVTLGTATFPADGDDLGLLFQTCQDRQREYRSSLLHRVRPRLDELGFPELVDALLSEPLAGGAAQSARLTVSDELFDLILAEVGREVARTVRARGSLYVGATDASSVVSLLDALPGIAGASRREDLALRVHVLTPRGGADGDAGHPLVEWIATDAERARDDRRFVLFLPERGAYGALRSPQGELFHTCDAPLVDLLVAKLLEHHDLRSSEGT